MFHSSLPDDCPATAIERQSAAMELRALENRR